MNTLPFPVLTRLWFRDLKDLIIVCDAWRGAIARRETRSELTSAHYLLYAVLMGRDWRKGFTPITSVRKIENGGTWNAGWCHAFAALHVATKSPEAATTFLTPFAGAVTSEMLRTAVAVLPSINVSVLEGQFKRAQSVEERMAVWNDGPAYERAAVLPGAPQ